jgi:hypothetical protein
MVEQLKDTASSLDLRHRDPCVVQNCLSGAARIIRRIGVIMSRKMVEEWWNNVRNDSRKDSGRFFEEISGGAD